MKIATVLVVDDEKALQDFVRRNLEVRHYEVLTASNGLEALALFDTHPVDLVILDIMMPHMDGIETVQRIRQKSDLPIILLTAMGDEADKVRAYDLGVDDYLTKPFGVGELLGRLRAVLRRSRKSDSDVSPDRLLRGEIEIDLSRHQLRVGGRRVELTPIEFNLLVFLMRNAGKVLTHEAILHGVWGPEYGGEVEYLRVYIGHLRRKIETEPAIPRYLLTERGIGYRFAD